MTGFMSLMRSLTLVSLASLLLAACGPFHSVTIGHRGHSHPEIHDGHGHGPPPHAPAHGYRRKHGHAYRSGGEVELVFDSGLGVYVVVGMPDYYFWNGAYLRIRGGVWMTSTHIDGHWRHYSERSLPHGLRAKHAKGGKHHAGKSKSKAKGNGKGKGAAKHD